MDKKNKNQEIEASKIGTVADLEAVYPELVSAVRDEMVREVGGWAPGKVKEQLSELYQRIAAGIGHGKNKPDLSVPGFLLGEFIRNERGGGVGDPFSESTLRVYARLKNLDGLELPYLLPFADPFCRATIEHYILISQGGGDQTRADLAKKVLAKCK